MWTIDVRRALSRPPFRSSPLTESLVPTIITVFTKLIKFLTVYLCFQFRGKAAEQLSKLPAKDFDAVAMKGEVLNSLTQATDEVDEDAQVKKLTSISSSLRWKGKL